MPKSSATPKAPRPYGKGRVVELSALNEVRQTLGDASRQRDLLIEHLHAIQDRFGYLSAAHIVALARTVRNRAVDAGNRVQSCGRAAGETVSWGGAT